MSTKIKTTDFLVQPGDDFTLSDRPTKVESLFKSKKQYRKLLREHVEDLSESQRMHYAFDCHAVLIIFQAMDAAGKGGAISRHVGSQSAGMFRVRTKPRRASRNCQPL